MVNVRMWFLVKICVVLYTLIHNPYPVDSANQKNLTVDFKNCFSLSLPVSNKKSQNSTGKDETDQNNQGESYTVSSSIDYGAKYSNTHGRRRTWLSRQCRISSDENDDEVIISLCIRLGRDGNLEMRDWSSKYIQIPKEKYCIKKSLLEQEEYENGPDQRFDDTFGVICSEFFDKPKEIWASVTTIRVILGVLVTLTSVCFVVIFIMHVRRWKEQGLIGWLTIGLVSTMFILHCIKGPEHIFGTTTNPQISTPSLYCVVTGISIHFLHLSSFSWLTVLSFDIWSTFRQNTLKAQSSKSIKRFLAYVAFAFGFPSVIVGVGLFLDRFYGNEDCGNIITPKSVLSLDEMKWMKLVDEMDKIHLSKKWTKWMKFVQHEESPRIQK